MEQKRSILMKFLSFFFIIALCVGVFTSCVTVNSTTIESDEPTVVEESEEKDAVEVVEEDDGEDEDDED